MPRRSHSSGPSQRQLRVGELIRRTLAQVLAQGELHDPELERLSITVGEVVVSGDLRVATAYVLPLGGDERAPMLAALHRHRRQLRHLVARQLDLKFAPELRFAIDETFDRLDRTRALFADPQVRRDVAGDVGDDEEH